MAAVPTTPSAAHLPTFGRMRLQSNRWDIVLLPLVLAAPFLFAWGGSQMAVPFYPGEALPISLDPAVLPVRLCHAHDAAHGPRHGGIAAVHLRLRQCGGKERTRRPHPRSPARHPAVGAHPGFLSTTVVEFLRRLPGSLLGPEAATILAIFTSQNWNMAFTSYASLRMIPRERYGAAPLRALAIAYRIPAATVGTLLGVLKEWERGRAPKSRFLRELEDSLSEDEAQRVLDIIIDWGRYAELFAYDHETG
jgi:hypothetical protein